MPRALETAASSCFVGFLAPSRTHADMGRIQRYGASIWQTKMPIDPLGAGVACMGRIVHVARGVCGPHGQHSTPAHERGPYVSVIDP